MRHIPAIARHRLTAACLIASLACWAAIPASQALAASSRRLPAAYNVSTYGDATRDYTSLAAWEAATDNDLVTAGMGEVLECYADAGSFSDGVPLLGATTSDNYFRLIMPAAGNKHTGTPDTGVKFAVTNYNQTTALFSINESYSRIHDLEITAEFNVNTTGQAINLSNNRTNHAVVGCLIYDIANIYPGRNARGIRSLGISFIVNCIVDNATEHGIYFGSGTIFIYCCTIINCAGYGISRDGGTVQITNCISQDNVLGQINWETKTTCATSGVTFAADGYHLASDDTGAIGLGTDLSADEAYAFDDDIDGDTRPAGAWDIGADEYMADTFMPFSIMYWGHP